MKKLIMASITAVVVIVVLAGTLIPILDDATATEDTFTNEGYFRMSHYDNTTDHVVSWTYEKPSIITVDDVDVPIGYKVANGNCSVIVNTDWLLRYYTDVNGNGRGVSLITSSGIISTALETNNDTATVNLTSGTMTATIAGTARNGTYTDVYVPDNNGAYAMKKATDGAYLNEDSAIYGFGLTRLNTNAGTIQNSPGTGFVFTGDIDNGVTGDIWLGSAVTVSDIVVNYETVDSHIDLYSFESITATATLTETVNDESVTTDTALTYSYVVVPYQVTAERSVHFTDGENAIFNAIPIIVIVALLLAIVAMVIRSRMD